MNNRHEKMLVRPDGSKVRIFVTVSASFVIGFHYDFEVWVCGPRKRTWRSTTDHDDYSWRKLDGEGRQAMDLENKLKHVTPDEVQAAMMELWESMRPNFSPKP